MDKNQCNSIEKTEGGDEFYEGIYVLYDHHPLSHLLVLKSLIWKIYPTFDILNRPPCPIVLVYSNFFIISEQETQTILFSNPPPPQLMMRIHIVYDYFQIRLSILAVHSILNPLWVVIKWTKQGCMVDYRGVTQLNSFVGLQLRSNILFLLLWHHLQRGFWSHSST